MTNAKFINACIQACGNWGILPTEFNSCMTWEEQVLWIARFLQEQVIPTVNENTEAFNTLKTYVENYFDNLDVQEEIDNKLDDMAESGELADIIAAYIQLRGVLAYDTVAAMKAADNLVDGSFAETYGFYAKGDGGSAKYKIREVTNADTVDEMTLLALSDESLVAELIKSPIMNVKQFGAKGDGETDDTAAIQGCLDNVSKVIIPAGTYMVDSTTSILPNDNNTITLCEDTILKAITNDQTLYAIIKIDNVDNVKIKGGIIQGERDTHIGETGEWGFGISVINNSSNVIITDITIKDTWGDGIYLNNCNTVRTQNVIIDNVRRNGISIISATNYKSTNDTIKNVNGTAPQSGVDVEPNTATDVLKNIVFDNLHTSNCSGDGFMIHVGHATEEKISIIVNNHYDDGSDHGESVFKHQDTDGTILFNSSVLLNSVHNGILCRGCWYSNCNVRFVRPMIQNCNTANSASVSYGTGIAIYRENSDSDLPIGNIEIVEPYIINHRSETGQCIYIKQGSKTANDIIKDIIVINPIYVEKKPLSVDAVTYDNFILLDPLDATGRDVAGTYTAYANEIRGNINMTSTNQSRTFTISDSSSINRVIKVTRLSDYNVDIILTNQTCTQLGVASGGTIRLTHYGDSITLRKATSTNWVVMDINCTPTIPE